MGSYQVTLGSNTPASFTIPGPCSRFQVTQVANAATTIVTGDGTGPVFPSNATVNNTTTQRVLPAVLGAQLVLQGPQPGSNMFASGGSTYPQVQLLSAGSPTIEVEW